MPERILIVGDTHASLDWAQTGLVSQLERFDPDLVLVAGDFGFWPSTAHGQAFLARLENTLATYGPECWFVDGNHEDHQALSELERSADGRAQVTRHIWYLPRGYRWTFGDTTWLALGGAVSVDRFSRIAGVDWFESETLSASDINAALDPGPVDVVLAHDAPAGIAPLDAALELNRTLFRSVLLTEADRHRATMRAIHDELRPQRWFHGHYHLAYRHEGFVGLAHDELPRNHAILVGPDGAELGA